MRKRLIISLAVIVASAVSAAPQKKPAAMAKPPEDVRIVDAKDKLRRILTDPDSANFRDLFVTGAGVVCGQFNAKNKMGGYGGFQRFLVTADQVRTEDANAAAFEYRWLEHCEENRPK